MGSKLNLNLSSFKCHWNSCKSIAYIRYHFLSFTRSYWKESLPLNKMVNIYRCKTFARIFKHLQSHFQFIYRQIFSQPSVSHLDEVCFTSPNLILIISMCNQIISVILSYSFSIILTLFSLTHCSRVFSCVNCLFIVGSSQKRFFFYIRLFRSVSLLFVNDLLITHS